MWQISLDFRGINPLSTVRILLVSTDTPDSLKIRQNLTELEYEVPELVSKTTEMLEAIRLNRPDLVLVDLALTGTEAFEIARQLIDLSGIPFIFLVSETDIVHLKKILTFFPNGLLLKPIQPEALYLGIELAVSNFYARKPGNHRAQLVAPHLTGLENTVFVPNKKGGLERIWKPDIYYLEGQSSYTTLYTTNGAHMLPTTLSQVSNQLSDPYFFRISKSHVVNLNHIHRVEASQYLIVAGARLSIGRKYKDAILDKIPRLRTRQRENDKNSLGHGPDSTTE